MVLKIIGYFSAKVTEVKNYRVRRRAGARGGLKMIRERRSEMGGAL